MLFPQVLQQSDHITIPHVHRSSQAVPRRNSRSRNDGKRPFGHFMITVLSATTSTIGKVLFQGLIGNADGF